MGRFRNATRKEELLRLQMRGGDPGRHRIPRLLGNLKLHRPLGFPLHHNRAGGDMTAQDHVVDAKADQIAASQLAIDGEVEQRKLPDSVIELQSNPDALQPTGASALAPPLFHGTARPAVVAGWYS
jgi:hypothetical protein